MHLLGLECPVEAAQGILGALSLGLCHHGRIHLGVLVGLALQSLFQVLERGTHVPLHVVLDRLLTHLHQSLGVIGSMNTLSSRGSLEQLSNQRIPLLQCLAGEGGVHGAGGALAYDSGLQIFNSRCHDCTIYLSFRLGKSKLPPDRKKIKNCVDFAEYPRSPD